MLMMFYLLTTLMSVQVFYAPISLVLMSSKTLSNKVKCHEWQLCHVGGWLTRRFHLALLYMTLLSARRLQLMVALCRIHFIICHSLRVNTLDESVLDSTTTGSWTLQRCEKCFSVLCTKIYMHIYIYIFHFSVIYGDRSLLALVSLIQTDGAQHAVNDKWLAKCHSSSIVQGETIWFAK